MNADWRPHPYLNSVRVIIVMVRPKRDRMTPMMERTVRDRWLVLLIFDVSSILAPIS